MLPVDFTNTFTTCPSPWFVPIMCVLPLDGKVRTFICVDEKSIDAVLDVIPTVPTVELILLLNFTSWVKWDLPANDKLSPVIPASALLFTLKTLDEPSLIVNIVPGAACASLILTAWPVEPVTSNISLTTCLPVTVWLPLKTLLPVTVSEEPTIPAKAAFSICNTLLVPSLTTNEVAGPACPSLKILLALDEVTIRGRKDSTLDDEPPSNLVSPFCVFITTSVPVIPARDGLLTPITVLVELLTSNIFVGPAPDASFTINEPLTNPAPFCVMFPVIVELPLTTPSPLIT